jgi:hypothetical protein
VMAVPCPLAHRFRAFRSPNILCFARMQVAQMEGITLDKEVFDLLPETKASQKGNFRRTHTVRRRKRWEVYRGLSKIVELPMPPCQQCPLR